MSTEQAAPAGHAGHGLRFAIAVTGAVAIALAISDAFAAFIAPILAVALVQPGGGTPPPLRTIALPLVLWLLATVVAAVTTTLASHPDVLIVTLAAVVFAAFRREASRGPSEAVGLGLTILAVVVPFGAALPSQVATIVDALGLGALAAALALLLAHALVPDRTAREAPAPRPPAGTALRESLGRTVVLTALLAWYVLDGKTDQIYILITALAILRLPQPTKTGTGLVAAAALGGLAALAAALLMVATPSPLFDLVLFAAMVLCFGLVAEGGGPRAALAQGAASTAIILLAIALTEADGSAAYLTRVGDIALTAIAVGLARLLFERPPAPQALGQA